MDGYIKLHRSMLEWEWYKDINTHILFIHLLLIANFRESKYKGHTIPRGSVVRTLPRLSEETGLTVKEIRTAISHLKSTGELGTQTTNKETVFTVHNYAVYQDDLDEEKSETGRQRAGKGQSNGRLRADVQNKKDKKIKNDKKDISARAHKFIPPTLEEITEYCKERNNDVDPKRFLDYFEASEWIDSTGKPVRNWKQKVITWEKGRVKAALKQSSSANRSYDIDEIERMVSQQYKDSG